MAQLINTDPFEACRPNGYLTQDDAVKGYSLATQLDDFLGQYPPEDTGSSGLAAAKAAVQLGYFRAYNHVFGFEHFTSVLQTQPLIVGTSWLDGMFDPDASGQVHVTGNIAGGHEYLALGVNYETATLTFLNSWGTGWGLGGRFTMSFRDFSYLLAQDGDGTAPVIPTPVPPTPPAPPVPPKPDTFCGKYRAIRRILAK